MAMPLRIEYGRSLVRPCFVPETKIAGDIAGHIPPLVPSTPLLAPSALIFEALGRAAPPFLVC